MPQFAFHLRFNRAWLTCFFNSTIYRACWKIPICQHVCVCVCVCVCVRARACSCLLHIMALYSRPNALQNDCMLPPCHEGVSLYTNYWVRGESRLKLLHQVLTAVFLSSISRIMFILQSYASLCYVYINTYVYMHIYRHIQTYIHMNMHAYIHTYKHTIYVYIYIESALACVCVCERERERERERYLL